MSGISTHVLDLTRGKPAANLPVRLERLEFGAWTEIASRQTDNDGRSEQMLPANDVSPGNYRLIFDTAAYQRANFYPEVIICFVITDGDTKYHLPLLLSAHGYTTYRGS